MTKPTISQVAEQNADHSVQTKYQCAKGTADMNIQQREEDARIGLFVDLRFPLGCMVSTSVVVFSSSFVFVALPPMMSS
jgi:hypothetical protein